MNTYNKQDFVSAHTLAEYAQSFGHSYDTMAKSLKADGLFTEWMEAWNKRNFEQLIEDEDEMEKINESVKEFNTVHSICRTSKYSYKSVKMYLDYKGYLRDEANDSDEDRESLREQLDTVMDADFITRRKTFYRRYKKQAEDRMDYFNDKHEQLGMILYANNYDKFTYKGIKIELKEQPKVLSVSKVKIVKALGAVKAKELFPELFEMTTKTSVTYKQFNDGVK